MTEPTPAVEFAAWLRGETGQPEPQADPEPQQQRPTAPRPDPSQGPSGIEPPRDPT
jgi:hypothetical protein